MPRYAKETTVPVERSRAEIEETLIRYGASEFHSGWKADAAMIAFRVGVLFIRFVLPLPARCERRFTHKEDRGGREVRRTDQQAVKEWDQETRQRWRALLLVIKAKLEAVECGISTLEQEFLSFIVVEGDVTLGEWMLDRAGGGPSRLQLLIAGGGGQPAIAGAPQAPPAEQPKGAEYEVKG